MRTSTLILLIAGMLAIPSVGQAVGMQVLKKIPLDGDGDVNVTSVLAVGDVNGDGQAEYALINGTEQAKVYDSGGSKLWEYRKPEHIANNELQPDRSTGGITRGAGPSLTSMATERTSSFTLRKKERTRRSPISQFAMARPAH